MAKRKYKPRPGFRFPGPVPKEALEFFEAKRLRPSFSYLDVAAEEHALAFTAAKSAGYDILSDVHEALAGHLAEGKTFASFRRELEPVLRKKGWWGEEEATDPETGKKVRAQLGSPRRLKTIFRANMRSARAAGQWERIQRTKRTHPFLLYRLGPSEEHRPEHVAWNGTLLPADDPWWRDHMTPNGWGCKCWVRQVSKAEAGRLGGPTDRPPREEVEWTNPRTGRTVRVDRGLDPSWASNPGLDRPRLLAEIASAKLGDIGDMLPGVAREAVRQAVESPLLERQMSPGTRRDPLPVGWLEPGARRELGAGNGVLLLDGAGAKHLLKRHANITPEVIRSVLPGLLREPDLVLRVRDHGGKPGDSLAFFWAAASGTVYKVAARPKRGRLRLATMHDSSTRNAEALLSRDLARDDPARGKQAEIVSGGLEALRRKEAGISL